MICASCGSENREGRKFCSECAAPLSVAVTCPACGALNEPGEKFCGECASPIAVTAGAVAAPTAASVARPSASTLAAAPAVAERRLVSVLFADLVGFTPFAEERDAEDVRETLTRYFDLASEVIGRYGGTVEKFIGDAVMAVWGAPTAREDDSERAVRAGLELVDSVRSLGSGIQARAGILTGEAAVTIGATNQGMVAGDLVNTAARLQSVAPPGAVLVGEATHRTSDRAIVFEPAGDQLLKGKASPVPAWRAVRVVAERGGRGRSETLEAPFVGRDDELRLLKDLFHATVREGRARLVSVIGPAGIGKSRLAWEFEKYADGLLDTVLWHGGRSPAYGDGITFWALGEMVRARCRLLESDDEATTRSKVADTLATYVPDEGERRWIEPALLTLLGVGGGVGSEQLFGAWRTFFERLAQTAPVALIFEDFHFADSGLMEFVDHLLEWSRAFPIYVMTLSRPELLDRRPDWGAARRNFTSVHLEPLTEPAMRELLSGLVPGLPEPAVRAIVSRADGIPLYAIETVRMLVSEGKLVLEDDIYRPVGDLTALAVPETLTALIAARLDGLEPDDRGLLSDAAVLGQSFTLAGLAAVSGTDRGELELRLRSFVRREILTVAADPRSPERGQYAFVQALIREVAYNTLAKRDRKVRHLAAARYFEALGSDELAGALAGHYLAAHGNAPEGPEADALAGQARLALQAAAARAASLGSHEQAITFLDQALSVASDPADVGTLCEAAAAASLDAAQYSRAEGHLRRAIEAYEGLGERGGALRATATLARAFNMAGRPDDVLVLLDAVPVGEIDERSEAALGDLHAARARAHLRRMEVEAAVEWAERALLVAERHERAGTLVEAMLVKATALNQLDRRFEVIVVCDGLARFAEARGLTSGAFEARNLFAYAVWDDDPPLAYSTIRADVDLSARLGDRAWWLRSVAGAGRIAISMGDWDWATEQAGEALAGELEPSDRLRLIPIPVRIRVLRGEDPGDAVQALHAKADGISDAGLSAMVRWVDSESDLMEARTADSIRSANAMVEAVAGFASDGYPAAARAALWGRDVEAARAALDAYEAALVHGVWPEADRSWMRGAIAALEGRREKATVLFQGALEQFRRLGMPFELARCQADMLIALGPGVPAALAAGREAHETLDRLGARPYVAKLDEVLTSGSTPADGPVSRAGEGIGTATG
jgi:class 3 adenylate cyclase/tetratricopeptide (TPR) repeat protein